MMPIWRVLLRHWLPEIDHLQSLPPVMDLEPGPEYQEAMDQARAARERAERIIAAYTESKPSTRPA